METDMDKQSGFWPNGARLAVSFSLMFEAGGQPISGAGGVIPDPIEHGLPDLPTNAFFQYGVYEGIPRILDLVDRHDVKLSSFMIGQAVDKAPDLAREIVRRGHEAAAHGRTWTNSYALDPEAERRFIPASRRRRGRRRSAGTPTRCAIPRIPSIFCRVSASPTTSTSRAGTSPSSYR
jgi:peptidoglycan/xylan/chitin deacetylase (PgdA/CDA1 family)